MKRCSWAKDELNIAYHDNEWGVPVTDDATLFEFLILEGAQAGLSWTTILNTHVPTPIYQDGQNKIITLIYISHLSYY